MGGKWEKIKALFGTNKASETCIMGTRAWDETEQLRTVAGRDSEGHRDLYKCITTIDHQTIKVIIHLRCIRTYREGPTNRTGCCKLRQG